MKLFIALVFLACLTVLVHSKSTKVSETTKTKTTKLQTTKNKTTKLKRIPTFSSTTSTTTTTTTSTTTTKKTTTTKTYTTTTTTTTTTQSSILASIVEIDNAAIQKTIQALQTAKIAQQQTLKGFTQALAFIPIISNYYANASVVAAYLQPPLQIYGKNISAIILNILDISKHLAFNTSQAYLNQVNYYTQQIITYINYTSVSAQKAITFSNFVSISQTFSNITVDYANAAYIDAVNATNVALSMSSLVTSISNLASLAQNLTAVLMSLTIIPPNQQQSLNWLGVAIQGSIEAVNTLENTYYQAAAGTQKALDVSKNTFVQLGNQIAGIEAIAQQQVFQGTQIALNEAQQLALQATQAAFAGIQSTISQVSDGINTGTQLIIEQANQAIKQANDIIHTVQDTGFLKKIQFLLHFNLLLIIIVTQITNAAEQAGKIEFHYIYFKILLAILYDSSLCSTTSCCCRPTSCSCRQTSR